MSVIDRRRAPFCWLELDALELIDGMPAQHRNTARSVYLAFAQLAARRLDGQHRGFEASRRELAEAAGVSVRTIDAYTKRLADLALVGIERQAAHNGASKSSVYVLTSPSEAAIEGGATIAPSPVQPLHPGGSPLLHGEGATECTPSRARPDAVKKEQKEENPPNPPQEGGTVADLNPRATGTNPRALAVLAARGPAPDPPTAALTARWLKIHAELRRAVGGVAWLLLEPLELVGIRGDELVLATPKSAAFISARYGQLIKATAAAHLAPPPATVRVDELATAA